MIEDKVDQNIRWIFDHEILVNIAKTLMFESKIFNLGILRCSLIFGDFLIINIIDNIPNP